MTAAAGDPFASAEHSVYWVTRAVAPRIERRPLPDDVDVAVIGGGFTGLALARQAASRGASVVVLERDAVGSGASSRNAGMCHPGLSVGPRGLVIRHGQRLGRSLYEDSEQAYDLVRNLLASERIDAEAAEVGQLGLAFAPAHVPGLLAERDELAEVGAPSRFLDRDELRAELTSPRYFAGLLVERCLGLNPARLVNGLAEAAMRYGAQINEGVPAQHLTRQRSGRIRVDTPSGSTTASEVVIATSGHTDGLVPWLRRRIVALSSYIIVTEPLSEDVARTVAPMGRMFYDSKNFLYYWRLTPDRRLLFGGRASFMPTSVGRTARILYRGMTGVYPQLVGTKVAYMWSGRVDFSYDRLPHAGRHEGVTYALGYCGSGVALSVYLGDRVGAWLAGDAPPTIAQIPFPLVPAPYEGRAWFLPLVGEWYRLKDRVAARSIPRGA